MSRFSGTTYRQLYSDSTRQVRVSPEFLRTIRRKNSIGGAPGMSSRATLPY
jgi:hypothetical protein